MKTACVIYTLKKSEKTEWETFSIPNHIVEIEDAEAQYAQLKDYLNKTYEFNTTAYGMHFPDEIGEIIDAYIV